MQYKRSDRLGLEIQRALADIIRNDLHDPRIGTLASIVKVELSNDLSYCKVFITVYGSDEEKQKLIKLEQAVKVLEKHKEKQREAYLEEEKALELRQFSEIGVQRFFIQSREKEEEEAELRKIVEETEMEMAE